jgi:MFS transporter, DHA1 family, solute carrier family 18 (vesicular amine transporter), member 1/2
MSLISTLQRTPNATLAVVCMALFMDYFLYGMAAPLVQACPAHVDDEALLGITYGAYALGLFVTTPILGFITDRVGRKKVMVFGIVCNIVATCLFAHGAIFQEIVAARLFQGIASACTWTAGLALVAESFKENRVQAIGIAFIGSTAGSVLGPSVAGFLLDHGGYTFPFMVAAGLLSIDFLMRTMLLAPHAGLVEKTEDMRHVIFDRDVLSAAFAVALAGASWAMMEPLVPNHIKHMPGGGASAVGFLFTISTVLYGFCAPLVGMMSEKIGVNKTICFGLAMSAVMLPLLALSNSVWTTGAVLCGVSFAYAFTLNPTSAELANAIDRKGLDCYALAYAIYNLAYSAGMIGSDSLITVAAHKLSLLQTLSVTSVLFLICIPLFLPRKPAPVAAPIAINPPQGETND